MADRLSAAGKRMSSFRSFLNLVILYSVLIVTTASCTVYSGPYRPESLGVGYSEVQLDKNLWQVTFRGGLNLDEEESANYVLLRCADLTLITGYRYFALADRKDATRDVGVSHSASSSSFGYSTNSQGSSSILSKSVAVRTIRMYKKKPGGNAFDAVFICNSMGKKYRVACHTQKSKVD